jgi:hypothetical protein
MELGGRRPVYLRKCLKREVGEMRCGLRSRDYETPKCSRIADPGLRSVDGCRRADCAATVESDQRPGRGGSAGAGHRDLSPGWAPLASLCVWQRSWGMARVFESSRAGDAGRADWRCHRAPHGAWPADLREAGPGWCGWDFPTLRGVTAAATTRAASGRRLRCRTPAQEPGIRATRRNARRAARLRRDRGSRPWF